MVESGTNIPSFNWISIPEESILKANLEGVKGLPAEILNSLCKKLLNSQQERLSISETALRICQSYEDMLDLGLPSGEACKLAKSIARNLGDEQLVRCLRGILF